MSCQKWILFLFIHQITSIEIELKENWKLKGHQDNKEIVINDITIPTNVHVELEKAGLIESVLKSKNENKLDWIGRQNWTFSYTFVPKFDFIRYALTYITFHGVDTVATIRFNDVIIGETSNMFTRYSFNIRMFNPFVENTISVEFSSPSRYANVLGHKNGYKCPPIVRPWNSECCLNMLRKVQTSFGWDNIPLVPTIGFWKPVVFELYDTALIRDVGYTLGEDMHTWYVNFQVHLEAGTMSGFKRAGTLSIEFLSIPYKVEECIAIETNDFGEFMHGMVMRIPKTMVKEWWPRGHGEQTMYSVSIEFEDSILLPLSPETSRRSYKLIKVAFRVANIYTPEVDPYGRAFYFNVNNVDIFVKGANVIPFHVYPDQTYNKEKLRQIFHAVIGANMNMLRVWAGGYYESDEFYDLADEYGILIWQDATFPPATYPVDEYFVKSVATEIRQNVRRLQRHPSLVAYACNDEVEQALVDNRFLTYGNYSIYKDQYILLFNETVRKIIAQNDYWRPILFTSPGFGYQIPYDHYEFFSGSPTNPNYGDVHYLSKSLSWNLWDYSYYTKARFISEYGYQSLPSKAAWEEILGPYDTIEALNEERQRVSRGHEYIAALIDKNLPPLPSKTAKNYWEKFIYYSQISQAMQLKAQMCTYRVERGRPQNNYTMGALLWHLNDVWVAPTYSIIESNGNYKIAWYYLRELYSDETVIGIIKNGKMEVYVINDTTMMKKYQVTIRIYRKNSLEPVQRLSFSCEIAVKSVYLATIIDIAKEIEKNGNYGSIIKINDTFIELKLFDDGMDDPIAVDFEFVEFFKDSQNLKDPKLEFNVVHQECLDKRKLIRIISIEIMVAAPAFFVHLEYLSARGKPYTFSQNGFVQMEPIKTIHLKFTDVEGHCNTTVGNKDIKVVHLMN